MKNFKRYLCVVLTLLLVVPGGLAEDMAQALTTTTEEINTSFEDDVSSDDASYDTVGNDGGVGTDGDVGNDAAAADENAEISASSIDLEVAEVGEMDLSLGDGDGEVESLQTNIDSPSSSTITYCFIALETLVASQMASDGDEIIAPDDPAAPDGMIFAGWELEDGTAVFTNDTPVIAHTDPIITEINVIAKFVEADSVSSDEDMGLEDEAATGDAETVAGDESTSNETEAAEEAGEDAPAVSDEIYSSIADETAPSVDNDADADEEGGDAGTDENVEEDGNADKEEADAAHDAAKDDEAANDTEAVNSADDEKDADKHTDEEENKEAVEKADDEAEPSDDEAGGESIEDESAEDEDSDEDNGEDNGEDSAEDSGEHSSEEPSIHPVRVVFNITPEDAAITVKAVNGKGMEEAADEAADAQTADVQTADDQPVDETVGEQSDAVQSFDGTPDTISEKEGTTFFSSEDDGSFALLSGDYTYTAEAEGYESAVDVPFTVAEDELIIDVALEAEEEDSDQESVDEAEEGAEDAVGSETEESAVEVPFDQSVTYNGVVVTVKADAGTFPAGAALSVSCVLLYEQRQADAAVGEVRDENTTVASSYTFDIKALDEEGNELQPANDHTVSVSFSTEAVADENLTTTVYHIEEDGGNYTVSTLETVEDGDTASAETDGFSLYTVEFVYGNKQYILEGGESVALSEILAELELVGEVATVSVSVPELFDAKQDENGEWIIESYRAFSSEEWMKVEINGQEYEITVTDDSEPAKYLDETGTTQTCSNRRLAGGKSRADNEAMAEKPPQDG